MSGYRDLALLQQSFATLGSAIERWKKEKEYNDLANSLVNQQSDGLRALPVNGSDPGIGDSPDQSPVKMPYTGGFAGLKIRDDLLNNELKRAQIARYLAMANRAAVPGSRTATGFHDAPYDAPEGTIWNGHGFVRDPAYVRPTTGLRSKDPASQLDAEMMKKFGVAPGELDSAQNMDLVDETGKPTTEEALASPTATSHKAYLTGDVGDRHFRIEREEARPYINRYKALLRPAADASAAVVRPQVDPAPRTPSAQAAAQPDSSRKLDPETAKAILAEAGGDKQKAREIARQRGYAF